jgi:hypothetical protein
MGHLDVRQGCSRLTCAKFAIENHGSQPAAPLSPLPEAVGAPRSRLLPAQGSTWVRGGPGLVRILILDVYEYLGQ